MRAAAQVDGESNRVLVKRFLVEAYPSIYLVRAGKVYVYEDDARSEEQVGAACDLRELPCAAAERGQSNGVRAV